MMVATRQSNGQRRGGKPGNNRKFKPGMMNGMGKMPRFNPRVPAANMNPMFSANQIPDNPGYVDFNEPTSLGQPAPFMAPPKLMAVNDGGGKPQRGPRRTNQGNAKRMNPQRNQNGANGWAPQRMSGAPMPQQMPPPPGPSGPPGMRNFQNPPMPRMGGRPPPGIRPPIIGPPPPPPPNMAPGRFGPPRPLMPPPMAGCPPPIGPPPLGGPMRPPPMRGAPMPPLPRGGPMRGNIPTGPGGPIRRNKNMPINRKNLRTNKRKPPNLPANMPNGGPNLRPKKSMTTKKTLNEIINQYPLDKPWVTDEIRGEHKKKEDIENRLKGRKDDKLFAEFKVQRDNFVKMYETARLEYIGKHPEQVIITREEQEARREGIHEINSDNRILLKRKDIDKIMTESSDKDKNKGANPKTNNPNANANEKQSAAT